MPTKAKTDAATERRRAGRRARHRSRKLASLGMEIQRFGTTRLLPIALSKEARSESCRLLNEILADSMILYALYKKHHWLVAGPTFYQLHLLFDKHAEEQTEIIDLLAERVQSLGGIAVGDPRHAAELTTIDRPPNGAEDVPAMIHRTLDAHETIIEKVRSGDRQDREERRLGLERPADGRCPAPPRVAGLVHRRARRGRATHRGLRRGAPRDAARAVGLCSRPGMRLLSPGLEGR